MSKAAKSFETKCKTFFDSANNGKPISISQLSGVIRSACPSFQGSDQDIAQMFLEIDSDSDKLVSWDEFSKALLKKDPKEVTRAELEEQFKKMDKDGSGKLDREEVRRVVLDMAHKQISEDLLDKIIHDVDPNKDGVVDLNEFFVMWNAKLQ